MGRKTIDLPDGSRYVGEVDEDGVPHGRGVLSWPSGARVEGAFGEGKAEGVGAWTYPDGSRYEGANRNDVPHGRGVRTWGAGGVRVVPETTTG